MKIFNAYSDYYDLLYEDKNYNEEVQYVSKSIVKHNPHSQSLLNLGCGTGLHDIEFAKSGFQVTGIDRSEDMISKAKMNEKKGILEFDVGDARTIRVDKKFDVAVSLFHVINYQNSNSDLIDFFQTAHYHLKPGGLFIFDSWYGPAVLRNLPSKRKKLFENSKYSIIRESTSVIDFNMNLVSVLFDIKVMEKNSDQLNAFMELHKMRYLFFPEVQLIAEKAGFDILEFKKWLTDETPDENSWYVYFVLKKTH
jgi:SAM-dependent methyltransferase